MMRLRVITLPAILAICALLLAAGSAAAKNFECRTALGPVTIHGNLVVPTGALCELSGTHVTGNATVTSGPPEPSEPTALSAKGATIDGNVKVQANAQFLASAGTTVGGTLHCTHCEVADVQGSTVKGSVQDKAVSEGAFIQNSEIGGNLQIQNGSDFFGTGFHIATNTIAGSMTFSNNTGASDISNNHIQGSLKCKGNSPPPTGTGNTAQAKSGQCAAL
jgi:hypothetical protein